MAAKKKERPSFDEVLKYANDKKAQESQGIGGRPSFESVLEYANTRNLGERLDSWNTKASSYLNSAGKDVSNISYNTAKSLNDRYSPIYNDISREGRLLREDLSKYATDENGYKDIVSRMEDFKKTSYDVNNAYKNSADYYGQFATEKDYNQAMKALEERQRLTFDRSNMTDEEYMNNVNAGKFAFNHDKTQTDLRLEQEKEDESVLEKIGRWLGEGGGTADTSLPLAGSTISINSQYQGIAPEYNAPEYGGIKWTDDDFNNFYALYGTDKAKAEEFAYKTNLANFQRQNSEAMQKVKDLTQWSVATGVLGTIFGVAASAFAGDKGLAYMTDVAGSGKINDFTQAGLGWSDLSNTFRNAVAEDIERATAGLPANNVTISTPLGDINTGNVASKLYNLGFSMLQSAAVVSTMGPAGTFVLGSGAATQGMEDAIARGLDPVSAIEVGAAAGIFETLFEYVSLENLVGSSPTNSMIKNILLQGGFEASEELFTTLADTVSDLIISGDKSELMSTIQEYIDAGMDEESAKKQAWLDWGVGLFEDALGGFLSGTGMSAGKTAMFGAGQVHSLLSDPIENKLGWGVTPTQTSLERARSNQGDLLKQGLENPEGSWMNNLAQKYNAKVENGQNLNALQLSRLMNANEVGMAENDIRNITDAARERAKGWLTQNGVNEADIDTNELETLANAIAKETIGNYDKKFGYDEKYNNYRGELTRAEKKALNKGQYSGAGQNVVKEFAKGISMPETNRIGMPNSVSGSGLSVERAYKPYKSSESTNTSAETEKGQNEASVNPTEAYNVSDDGKTLYTDSQSGATQAVDISRISENSKNGLTLELADGRKVNSDDISFGTQNEAVLYNTIKSLDLNAEEANQIVSNVPNMEEATPESIQKYVYGMHEGIMYGATGQADSIIPETGFYADLSPEMKAYSKNLGRIMNVRNTEAAQKSVSEMIRNAKKVNTRVNKVKGNVYVESGFKGNVASNVADYADDAFSGLSERQSVSVEGIKFLAKRLGTDIYLFDSKQEGIRANGFYRKSDNSIHIDINAGQNYDAMIPQTLAHEITHQMKEMAPASFKKLGEFLTTAFGEKGVSVDQLVRNQISKSNNTLSYEGAFEEVVADACQNMLTDGTAFEKLAELKKQNVKLYQKLINFLKAFVKRLKDAFSGVTPDSMEARIVQEKMQDRINQLQSLWNEGLAETVKGNQAFKTLQRQTNTEQTAAENGENIKFSFSSIAYSFFGDESLTSADFENGDYKKTTGYNSYVNKCADIYTKTHDGVSKTRAKREIAESIDGIVRVALAAKKAGYDILDDPKKRNIKDSKGRKLFQSLEPNSDYFTSSDISTICDKRMNFAEIYDEIVKRETKMGVPANKRFFSNVDNYFYIHKVLAEKGLTTPCYQCYVESMRKNLMPMAQAFLKLINETDTSNKSNEQLYNKSGKDKGKLKENNYKLRENVLAEIAEEGRDINEFDINTFATEDGLTDLKLKSPKIYEAFNSFYGQSKPKMPKEATPFRFGELIAMLTDNHDNIKTKTIDKINATGGFRLQSYSDFQIVNYVDVLQTIFEAGILGLNGHAYTKVPAFLDATKGTNLKRNVSIFMYNDGGEWKLDKSDSFPAPSIEDLYDIVNSDPTGNASIIAVSQNADMSAYIMANDNIGYGIPFHKSGLKMGVVRGRQITEDGRQIKGYSKIKDHTKQQTEVWAKTNEDHKAFNKVKKPINIYGSEVNWDFDNKDGLSKNELIKKNLKSYIDACYNAGYLPKFREYVMNNSGVLENVLKYSKEMGYVGEDATIDDISFKYRDYVVPYGYYKFLGDFGMFKPDGTASPHDTLSLAGYDFDKAVELFNDSENLRRNEILQQFANGEERQKYRESKLTAEELADIIKQKRTDVVNEIIAKSNPSYANDSDIKLSVRVSENDTGSDSNADVYNRLKVKMSDRYSSRSEVELGTLFSGADTFAYALDGLIHTQYAAENRPEIVSVYKMNHGGIVFNDVLDIDIDKMPNVQHLHVSPPCVNFSNMNNAQMEKPIDIKLATKVADIITAKKPRALTIENVAGYATSKSMNIIRNALAKAGYKSVDIATYKDSDYGGYTNRERVILRAMRDEALPAVRGKVAKAKGWGEAVGMDYINSLPEAKTTNPRMIESLKNLSGIDVTRINRPLLVFGESYKNKQFGHAFYNQTLPTIIAESGASRIFLPDGTVKEATPEVLAKIMGIDGFKLPKQVTTARRVIGNGIPAAITQNVMGPVIEQIEADNKARIAKGEDIKFSSREFAKGAEDYYGTTKNWELGGYLTVNGKMLDFSAGQRQRVIDHREIADYYEDQGIELSNDIGGSGLLNEGMIRFMNDGNIRFQSHNGFEIVKLPTKEQFGTLRDIINNYFDGYLSIDYSDETGRYLGTTDYDEGTSASRIIADIKKHFEDGVIPEGNVKFSDRYSERDDNATDNRTLLVNALESVAKTAEEKQKLANYKNYIGKLNEKEELLTNIRGKIKELSFGKGTRDTERIQRLKDQANELGNLISKYDRKLLTLEAEQPLRNVIDRQIKAVQAASDIRYNEAMKQMRDRIDEQRKEFVDKYAESRAKAKLGRDKTEVRHKIRKTVKELYDLMLRPTKDKHVMKPLQDAVSEALTALGDDTKAIGRMSERLTALRNAYAELKTATDYTEASMYDDNIRATIDDISKTLGDKALKDLSLTELEKVNECYKMILTTVKNANKAFKASKQATISELAEKTMHEVGNEVKSNVVALEKVYKEVWNTMKPVYAMRAIGSGTLNELYKNLLQAQYDWKTDMDEAMAYKQERLKKYKYNTWDMKKKYTMTSSNGKALSLTLPQIMSIYAYSKRPQAGKHLEIGGIVFDEKATYRDKGITRSLNDKSAYTIDDKLLSEIISKLTPEQKAYVDEMQSYLSDVMGAKGNEVSNAMYGIDMFKEKNYFPLKGAKAFLFEQNEASGEVKLKNSGFTKDTVPNANNPITMSDFDEVWSQHVNDMSTYHTFTLPIEDFNRVYNYRVREEGMPGYDSVKARLQNAFHGDGVTTYISNLIKDINGGAISPTATGVMNKLISGFKKGATFASASVVIQQPSAIGRAMAYVKPKYFVKTIPSQLNFKAHEAEWAELKKYAPIAGIKEMGYFDTGMGRSAVDWLNTTSYEGFRDKFKAFFTDSSFRDEILSKAPAFADELTWTHIWKAIKAETRTTTNLKPGTDEFFKRCADRFNEVIELTQVYDSVLTRSGFMRSKDTGVKMATAFMAEPTVSLNMVADAIIQGKRLGGRAGVKLMGRVIGAVIGATVLNSLLKAVVSAARDDDEKYSYLDKYAKSAVGDLVDNLNPLSLIPWAKDVVSIWQDYDVNRADMNMFSDLKKAFDTAEKDNVSTGDKVMALAGAFGAFFGLPIKNIQRDVKAAINLVDMATDDKTSTDLSFWRAVEEGLGIEDTLKDISKAYDDGDFDEAKELLDKQVAYKVSDGKTEKEAKTSVRSSMTSYWKPMYLEAYAAKDESEMARIRKVLYDSGCYGTADDVVKAVQQWVKGMK